MKWFNPDFLIPILTILTISCSQIGAETNKTLSGYNDGPYILYEGSNATIWHFQKGSDSSNLISERYSISELKTKQIEVFPNSNMAPFYITLFDYIADPDFVGSPKKTVVISDIEGNFVDFVNILTASGVMNDDYSWEFGKNHLVFNGDLFDRGTDVMAVIWLCYKLDYESRKVGGRVHIILGNHEEMNLRGNTKYVDKRYLDVADQIGVEYKQLFNENTEIGRWLRSKNTITRLGKTLFVHGGISSEVLDMGLTSQQINNVVRENLGKNKEDLNETGEIIWGNAGPFWFRGLILSDEKYLPVSSEIIDTILTYFGADKIIVGHCIAPEVTSLHNGRVIAVDVDHPENRDKGKSRALIITRGSIKGINDSGKRTKLPALNGFLE